MPASTSPMPPEARSRICRTCRMWLRGRMCNPALSRVRRRHRFNRPSREGSSVSVVLRALCSDYLNELCGESFLPLSSRRTAAESAENFSSADRLIHYAAMETWKSGPSAPRERSERDQGFSPRRGLPRFFLWLLPLSFALQVASIGIFHQYRTRAGNDNFEFGWEMGRIGRSLAQGHGFSSPYEGNTGPTAWEPPLYPFL